MSSLVGNQRDRERQIMLVFLWLRFIQPQNLNLLKVTFTLRVGLTSSVKPLWKNAHTRTQTCVSMVSPNLIKLSMKMNHHRLCPKRGRVISV